MMANLQVLKKFDLNLLVIFECVYLHRSISKAAEALFLTPSAISQSIQRLRNQLNDPLFLREGKGITPTTVADNLHIYLEDNLQQLEQTIEVVQGAPRRKNFIVYCSTYMGFEFLPALTESFCRQQGYELVHYDMSVSVTSAEDLLTYRKADLIICSKDHPRMGSRATFAELEKEKFAQIIMAEEGVRLHDIKLSEQLPKRQIVFQSDSPITVMAAVGNSELLALVGLRGYHRFKDTFNLRLIELPTPLPPLEVYMMYNRFALQNSAFRLLIDEINRQIAGKTAG